MYHPFTIFPLGDSALTIEFGSEIDDAIHERVLAFYYLLKEADLPFITDIIPAYASLTLNYQVAHAMLQDRGATAFAIVAAVVESLAKDPVPLVSKPSRTIEVPVCYAARFAPDLESLSVQNNLSIEEIIRLHTSVVYKVYTIGFLPGFAYMGVVDDRIAVSRHATPRTHIAPGSVGIAGRQTGIYPLESPGGWRIIGRTPVPMFRPQDDPPSYIHPGDRVKFYSITEDEFAHY